MVRGRSVSEVDQGRRDDGGDHKGKTKRLTGNAQDSTIFEFISDRILDFLVRFVVDRRWKRTNHKVSMEKDLEERKLAEGVRVPVASSRMITFAFLTSARANETRDRWKINQHSTVITKTGIKKGCLLARGTNFYPHPQWPCPAWTYSWARLGVRASVRPTAWRRYVGWMGRGWIELYRRLCKLMKGINGAFTATPDLITHIETEKEKGAELKAWKIQTTIESTNWVLRDNGQSRSQIS